MQATYRVNWIKFGLFWIKSFEIYLIMLIIYAEMESKLGTHSDKVRGETSGSVIHSQSKSPRKVTGTSRSSLSDVQPDSSDVESSESSDSELEESEFSRLEPDFELVRNKKKSSGLKGNRGRGPKIN